MHYNARLHAEIKALSRLIRPSKASLDDLDNWHCDAELGGSQGLYNGRPCNVGMFNGAVEQH